MAKAVLDEDGWNTLGEPSATRQRVRRVVGMPELADMYPPDFVLAPAEEGGPCRIDAGEIAVEIGHAEEVFRDMPNPIAFPDALGNFCLQPFIQNAKCRLFADALGGLDASRQDAGYTVWSCFVRDRAVTDRKSCVFDDRSLSLYGPGEVFREKSFAFAAKDGFIEWPELGVDLPPDLT